MMQAVAVVLGVLTWTFVEYVLHRWAGHVYRHNPFGVEHQRHHLEGDYFAPAWKKAAFAVVVVALLGIPAHTVAPAVGLMYVCSFVATWLTYEWLHWRAHRVAGWEPYGRWLRRHHFAHHFHGNTTNHGVTSPLWDHVFGTWRAPPAVIRVPEALAMRWLVDPETGGVRAELADGWEIRRRGA